MKAILYYLLISMMILLSNSYTQNQFESDIIKTSSGDLTITFIAHGTLLFKFDNSL